ncbi:MAG: hypothetical protein KBC35_01180 [Candidatus Pacebacteria bacterium]|jgi:hypothetical protein|nr:hypothetical protein [Candidatus Paceibacterota bacterium]
MVGKSRETTSYSKATLACFGLLVAAIVAYLYFLNMSVVQVVMRTEQVQKQRDLSAEIAMLESSYIEAQHKIAARIATLDNQGSAVSKIFVSRDQASLVLRGN